MVLFDNYDTEQYMADAREYLEESGDYYTESELYNLRDLYIEEASDWVNTLMDKTFDGNKLIVTGSVGRWNGRYVGAEIYDTWAEFLSKFGKDCDYFKIYTEGRHLYVKCSHHDGDNFCEVKVVTDAGDRYYDNWYYEADPRLSKYHEAGIFSRMLHNSKYTRCPKIRIE